MAKDRDGDRDIVAEIINMVAAQVSSGMRVRCANVRSRLDSSLRGACEPFGTLRTCRSA